MNEMQEKLFNPLLGLSNDKVQLRIAEYNDFESLKKIAFDLSIWTYFPIEIVDEAALQSFIEEALNDHSKKQRVTFVIIDREINSIAGMTSFGNISYKDKRLEIGWSWLTPNAQGTGINQINKSLMLQFAFNELNFVRVEFKTDVLNIRARKALLKIGAREEGVLRSHTLMHHERRRDTIYYSILSSEWKMPANV